MEKRIPVYFCLHDARISARVPMPISTPVPVLVPVHMHIGTYLYLLICINAILLQASTYHFDIDQGLKVDLCICSNHGCHSAGLVAGILWLRI